MSPRRLHSVVCRPRSFPCIRVCCAGCAGILQESSSDGHVQKHRGRLGTAAGGEGVEKTYRGIQEEDRARSDGETVIAGSASTALLHAALRRDKGGWRTIKIQIHSLVTLEGISQSPEFHSGTKFLSPFAPKHQVGCSLTTPRTTFGVVCVHSCSREPAAPPNPCVFFAFSYLRVAFLTHPARSQTSVFLARCCLLGDPPPCKKMR